LVEGLKGGAANEKGEVTLTGLVKYLQERVPKRVLQDLGPGKDQKPFAIVEGYRADELVISVRDPKTMTAQLDAPEPNVPARSIQVDNPTADTSVAAKEPESGSSLAGTSWTGTSPEAGEYTINLLKEGQLQYIINVLENGKTAPRTVKGKWKQSGNHIQLIIGNSYSVLQGTLDGSIMKGEGTNQEGTSWKWTLFKKE